MRKFINKLAKVGAFVPFALGALGISSGGASSIIERSAWERALALNTTVAYSRFILSHAESSFTDEAFCRLYELDGSKANATERKLRRDYSSARVDFATCETSSSARLFNI